MADTNPTDGAHSIRFAKRPLDQLPSLNSIAALSDYLEQCDNRRIASDGRLFLSAADRLTRDDIVTAVPLCINIIRIGTTLVFPNGEAFGRDDINANLSLRLVLALATLDEVSRQPDAV
jgi:hypothetical protein